MTRNGDDTIRVVPVTRQFRVMVGRVCVGATMLVLGAMLLHSLLFSTLPGVACHEIHHQRICGPGNVSRFSWAVVGHYFVSMAVVKGLAETLLLTVAAMAVGVVLGVLVAIMRLSPSRVISAPAWLFTWFFRGTPVYVQLLFWFNISALFPHVSIGVPFGPTFWHLNSVTIFTSFVAALVGLGLNEGAYMSEIVRAGVLAVDEGQVEAATSIGLTRLQTMRLVVLPQAMRVIIPPTGNELISMLKTSSLASAVGVVELLKSVVNVYSNTYQIIPLLTVASLWYLVVTTILSIGQYYVERHFSKGALRNLPATPWERVRHDVAEIVRRFRTRRYRPGAA